MSDGMKTKGNPSPAFNTIKSTTPITDSTGTTIYYVVNYEPTGFIIMAADNRVEPILAFSETSNFNVENIANANGLAVWDGMTKSYVQAVRQENEPQTPEQLLAWEPENLSRVVGRSAQPEPDPPTDPDGRPDGNTGGGSGGSSGGNNGNPPYCICGMSKVVGPFLLTTWNQLGDFNQYAPNYNCKLSYPNRDTDRAPVGCLPLAVGTVMRYHKCPTTRFDWTGMNDYLGTPSTAYMLHVIGLQMNASYACGGTSVSMTNAAAVLRQFNYPLAQLADYSEEKTIANLNLGYPVILSGGRKAGSILFPRSEDEHAWVCDGYKIIYPCSLHNQLYSTTYYYMKWGQQDHHQNGWYYSKNWAPRFATDKGYKFDYHLQMIHSIIPSYNN